MYQVAIVGAGQLGSRHLQGLKTASLPLSITVVDCCVESLNIAKERYEAIEKIGEKGIRYVNEIDELPKLLDLVIVATGSKPRASIIKGLLKHSEVRYLVLEKVLFTTLSDYDDIELLLEKNDVRAWVNCPRRLLGSYSYIKNKLQLSEPIKMDYIGKDWGLCCNAMHFIDIFMYLVREELYDINTDGVESMIYESKRSGYIEMKGTLRIKTERGNELLLSSVSECEQSGIVHISDNFNHFILYESKGILAVEGEEKELKVETPFQSQLTGLLADIILKTGCCPLSTYKESAQYHRLFITKMLEKYNEISGKESKELPIT